MYSKELIARIRDYMMAHGETIAVAESVTSGHLQAALSIAEQASGFFQGGLTAYNLGQKVRHLNIEPIHATLCNCVSEKIAGDMAIEACKLFSSDWGLGITGYAAPLAEQGVNSLFAFYSIASGGNIVQTGKLETKLRGSEEVQVYYAHACLEELCNYLERHK